jgi:Methyltransferase domain
MTEELRGNDPARWGHSLANLGEIMFPVLDAVKAKSVAEVGAYAGDLTRDLLDWAGPSGARIVAIDPAPQPELVELSEERADLDLIREPSHSALPKFPRADVVIIDGDHNYHTVTEDLRLVGERFTGPDAPLLMLHDVGWPHGRRDAYYAPDQIPEGDRQPMVEGGCLFPGEPGIVDGGLPYKWVARREGGARNGVLTALEEFVGGRDDLRLVVVPAFFGLGVVWRHDAPWTDAVADLISPWDANPIVARLEANRVYHLAHEYSRRREIQVLFDQREELANFLRGLMTSRAFRLAERLSRLRRRGRGESWSEAANRLIGRG